MAFIPHAEGLRSLWQAACEIIGPELSSREQQRLGLYPTQYEAYDDDPSDPINSSDADEMIPVRDFHRAPQSTAHFDPVFFRQFGIRTNTLFTKTITADPDCLDKIKKGWDEYRATFTLKPSKEDKRIARLFDACIYGSASEGDDPWTKKYEIRWVHEAVGFGVYAKESYEIGDVIGYYAGYLTDSPINHDYAFGFDGSSFEGLHIDGTLAGNAMRFVNHTPDHLANVKTVEYYKDGLPFIMFVAKNKIYPGEALLYDYGGGYWETKGISPFQLNTR
ncbi:MAG: SET domain-containing protein-lysine N-methyltransferase [Verrucomicrobia bacterium]|nr:SET domain-containing protein-lysine N-methyltransferase [Verrucomicrobiota bacterium]